MVQAKQGGKCRVEVGHHTIKIYIDCASGCTRSIWVLLRERVHHRYRLHIICVHYRVLLSRVGILLHPFPASGAKCLAIATSLAAVTKLPASVQGEKGDGLQPP